MSDSVAAIIGAVWLVIVAVTLGRTYQQVHGPGGVPPAIPATTETWSAWWWASGPTDWLIVVVAISTAVITLKTLRALIAANQINRDALVADQRAWIGINVRIAGPLAYDSDGWDAGTRWHLRIEYQLHHFGRSPATNVVFSADLVPLVAAQLQTADHAAHAPLGTDADRQLETLLSVQESMSAFMSFGARTLFPGEEVAGRFHINVNPSHIQAALQSGGYMGQFLLITGVTYASNLSDRHHRTGKVFNVYKRTGNQMIDLAGETVTPEALGLVPFPLGAGQTT